MFLKKKIKSKGIRSKIVSLILVIALLFGFSDPYSLTTQAKGVSNVITVEDNGIIYTITQLATNDGRDFIVTTDDTKDKVEISIYDNEIEITEYEYDGKNFFGKEKYDVSEETIDISGYIEDAENMAEVSAQAISYGSKTTETWGKHWYCYGSNGSKSYIKIGQTATYQIRTDTLVSAKETKCDNYAKAIKASNSSYAKAVAYAGGSSFLIGFAVGLIIGNAAFPPSIIVTLIIAAVGGGTSIVNMSNCLIDSYSYYKDCKDLYAVIKGYGTKL